MKCDYCQTEEKQTRYFELTSEGRHEGFLCENCIQFLADKWLVLESFDALYKITCPYCATSLGKFLRHGLKGCNACLRYFLPLLSPLAEKMQREAKAAAKRRNAPKPIYKPASPGEKVQTGADPTLKLLQMKERLEALIYDQRYEEARTLSEEILKLKTKLLSSK